VFLSRLSDFTEKSSANQGEQRGSSREFDEGRRHAPAGHSGEGVDLLEELSANIDAHSADHSGERRLGRRVVQRNGFSRVPDVEGDVFGSQATLEAGWPVLSTIARYLAWLAHAGAMSCCRYGAYAAFPAVSLGYPGLPSLHRDDPRQTHYLQPRCLIGVMID
jgi:hypothetical protein